jgi:hypothetical protein
MQFILAPPPTPPPTTLQHLNKVARLTASGETHRLAEWANRNPPQLKTHDRVGNRVDVVEFHPVRHLGSCMPDNYQLVMLDRQTPTSHA